MILITILNAILAVGVIVMVVTPLVWAILTQHRDHPRPAATDDASVRQPDPQGRGQAPQPRYKPLVGRA